MAMACESIPTVGVAAVVDPDIVDPVIVVESVVLADDDVADEVERGWEDEGVDDEYVAEDVDRVDRNEIVDVAGAATAVEVATNVGTATELAVICGANEAASVAKGVGVACLPTTGTVCMIRTMNTL